MIIKIFFGICLLVAITAIAEERVVNVYNWVEYIDPSLLKQF